MSAVAWPRVRVCLERSSETVITRPDVRAIELARVTLRGPMRVGIIGLGPGRAGGGATDARSDAAAETRAALSHPGRAGARHRPSATLSQALTPDDQSRRLPPRQLRRRHRSARRGRTRADDRGARCSDAAFQSSAPTKRSSPRTAPSWPRLRQGAGRHFATKRARWRACRFSARSRRGRWFPTSITSPRSSTARRTSSSRSSMVTSCGFDQALAAAQALGLTEPDPSRDLDGLDAADKLSLLAPLFGWGAIAADAVDVQGIRDITSQDLEVARSLGATIKPVVWASRASRRSRPSSDRRWSPSAIRWPRSPAR